MKRVNVMLGRMTRQADFEQIQKILQIMPKISQKTASKKI